MKTLTLHVGIIGGLATGAASRFYEELAREFASSDQRLSCTMVHADTNQVLALVLANQVAELASYLNALIIRLQDSGAELIALPAVTPHCCIGMLQQLSPLPIVNLLDVIRGSLKAKGAKRIAVFGTRFVMDTSLFGSLPASLATVALEPEYVDELHQLYIRLVRNGRGTIEDIGQITEIAAKVIAGEQVDTVVLAGTDFVVLPHRGFTFSHVDCFDEYLHAVADRARSQGE